MNTKIHPGQKINSTNGDGCNNQTINSKNTLALALSVLFHPFFTAVLAATHPWPDNTLPLLQPNTVATPSACSVLIPTTLDAKKRLIPTNTRVCQAFMRKIREAW